MAIVILDGKGGGTSAHVDAENRLHTLAVTQTEAHHVSRADEEMYITNAATTADALTLTATLGAILLIRNNSSSSDLVIQTILVSTSAAGTILLIRKNDTIGTIADNNTETARNLNFASGNVADATIYSWDEQNNGLGGLTAGQIMHTGYLAVGTTPFEVNGTMHLGKNDNIVLATKLGTPEFTASISFYFESTDFD